MNRKLYTTTERPATMYRFECWVLNKNKNLK